MPREERLDFLIRREFAAPGLRQAFANSGDVSLLVLQAGSQCLVGEL